MVTEITRRHEHEVFHNEDIPDSDSDEFEHIENREGAHDYSHGKSENFIEYVAVPKGGSPSQGVKVIKIYIIVKIIIKKYILLQLLDFPVLKNYPLVFHCKFSVSFSALFGVYNNLVAL